jgi:hypothetical protein
MECFVQQIIKVINILTLGLNINNSRIVLLENLRQSCIYNSTTDLIYWNYMEQFGEICADASLPMFTVHCANHIIDILISEGFNIDKGKIDNCIKNQLMKQDGLAAEDTNLFRQYKFNIIPELVINHIPYTGSWHSSNIYDAICNTLPADRLECDSISRIAKGNSRNVSIGTVVLMGLVVMLAVAAGIYCYKRIMTRSLDILIDERVNDQTRSVIAKYAAFNESKPVDERTNF